MKELIDISVKFYFSGKNVYLQGPFLEGVGGVGSGVTNVLDHPYITSLTDRDVGKVGKKKKKKSETRKYRGKQFLHQARFFFPKFCRCNVGLEM